MAPRKYLLTQNHELRPLGVYNWTLPALSTKLDDGRFVSVCPNADACANLCYARNGTYMFPSVKAAHNRNLELALDTARFEAAMTEELEQKRYRGGKWVRIHDSGDFFDLAYAMAWVRIAARFPDVNFYAYTKEVEMWKGPLENCYGLRAPSPGLVTIIFSLGGKQDHLIDRDVDRHADVFPSIAAATDAGYTEQEDDDRLAASMPNHRVAVIVNNIRHFVKRQGDDTFGSLQAKRDQKREAHR